MKEYKFTDDEIGLILIAIGEEIIKAKKNIEEGVDISTNEYLRKKYKRLADIIEISRRYAKEIDKLS